MHRDRLYGVRYAGDQRYGIANALLTVTEPLLGMTAIAFIWSALGRRPHSAATSARPVTAGWTGTSEDVSAIGRWRRTARVEMAALSAVSRHFVH